ncbi:MAG: AAA family ATPase [Fibrobacteraceae bacterium]|nr:AAA family ATPase [Fibrobacteraceae bacterium]
MVTEKIIIENFSIIKKMELDISKFILLIGPQASGKSLVAKIDYFMNESISALFLKNLSKAASLLEFEKDVQREFSNLFPSYLWVGCKFSISRKKGNDFYFTISRSNRKTVNLLKVKYSESFKNAYETILNVIKREKKNSSLFFWFDRDIFKKNNMETINWMTNGFFIPAGRSFFSAIHDNLFTLLSSSFDEDNSSSSTSLANIDPFMKIFGRNYERIKGRPFVNRLLNTNTVSEILKGQYIREKGKDFIERQGERIRVENSSSGQQEVLPMLMTILSYANQSVPVPYSSKCFFIEELEAHIFPESQKQIVDLVASLFNNNYGKVGFVLTTHSPYVATAINNAIMKSGKKGIKYAKSDFSAYEINNGKIKNIIESETGLIDANIIDSVSSIIADEFDKLL